MAENFRQYFDQVFMLLLCFWLPGIIFLFDGIRAIGERKTVVADRDSGFHWKEPYTIY